jgi:hypothetical protein
MWCTPGLIFGGTEGVRSRFHIFALPFSCFTILFSCFTIPFFTIPLCFTIPFSCFSLPNMFLAVRRTSGLVFMFCSPGHVFGGTEGVRSRFHLLHARTHFRRNRGRRLPFLCFGSRFHVLRARTLSRRYRRHRVPFSYFAVPCTFLVFRRASGVDFMFCAPGLVVGGTEGVSFHTHVLRSKTRFGRYRGRCVPL